MLEIPDKPENFGSHIKYSVLKDGKEIGHIVCYKQAAPFFVTIGSFVIEADELMQIHREIKKLDAVRLRAARKRA
jgi:hypothetical protein